MDSTIRWIMRPIDTVIAVVLTFYVDGILQLVLFGVAVVEGLPVLLLAGFYVMAFLNDAKNNT